MPGGGSESFDFRGGQRWRLSGFGKHRRASGQPVSASPPRFGRADFRTGAGVEAASTKRHVRIVQFLGIAWDFPMGAACGIKGLPKWADDNAFDVERASLTQLGSRAIIRAVRPAIQWLVVFALAAMPTVVGAQWLNYRTPGIPRLPNGAPDLKAPAPRMPDGKPDFSGMWFANVPSRDYCREKDCIQEERMAREQIDLGLSLKDGLPYTEWSKEQMKARRANGGREDPHSYCMPPNFPRAWTLPQHSRIVQTPGLMVVLHEFNAAYREIYLDGRPLPVNPNPTWNGYSTGHWEGDTLVIETNGIRDDMWLDIQGSPITESARVTERLNRLNLGLLQIEIGVNDPRAYTKPWSVTIEMALQVDTQMLEEICMDNEKDTKLYQK